MDFKTRGPFLSNRMLHLVLMPTEQCNFRCSYCYEDFAAGEMPRWVIEAVKALMANRVSNLDLLALAWFGGEPLLAWPIVEEIQSFAWELALRHPEARLVGSMTTNGSLLTLPRFERLLELGVRKYQISFDGSREHHDATRLRLGGGGSFATIWRNVLALRSISEDFSILLRLHVTSENQQSLDRLLGDLARELEGDRRFSVMFKAIRRFGGPNDSDLPILLSEQEEAALGRLVEQARDLGLLPLQDVYAQSGMLQGCFASALGSYVVRSTGDLAKCAIALGHSNNRVGVLCPDGTVALDSEKMNGWLRGALNGEPESIGCPMKGWADDAPQRKASAPRLIQISGRGRSPAGEQQQHQP